MYWLIRPDAVAAFEDEGVKKALSRYIEVSSNKKTARFLITKSIPVDVLPTTEEELWKLHEDKMGLHENKIKLTEKSLLDLKIALANKILEHCHFCERRCNVDRTKKEKGFCNLGKETRLSSEFLHMGEEACLVPSHTFFFISCNLYCIYCQNWSISRQFESGVPVTGKELALIAKKRRILEKSRNINLVGGEPTPNLHTILEMLKYLEVNVPVVWNSNMYMSEEAMKLLNGVVDVYLADFKYGNDECAKRLSKAKNYFEVVSRNHLLAKQHAELLIRHLVLPAHVECCSRKVIEWIAENLGNEVRLNIMAQYHPEFEAFKEKDITRRVTSEEMQKVFEIAKENGLWNLD